MVRAQDTLTSTPRLIVLTDSENEPDDSQSMVRLLTCANGLRIEGLMLRARWSGHTPTAWSPSIATELGMFWGPLCSTATIAGGRLPAYLIVYQ